VADEAEQAAITRAKRMRGRGKSLRYIAGKLALDGHRPQSEERATAVGSVERPVVLAAHAFTLT
jgi:hypothetical protein